MGRYGKLANCVLVWNHVERRNKGFGFVTYERIEDAIEAVNDMNGRTIEGRPVRVDFSYTKHGNKEHMYDGEGKRKEEYRRSRERSRSPRHRSRSPRRRHRSRSYSR